MRVNVQMIFYSVFGRVWRTAQAVAEGALRRALITASCGTSDGAAPRSGSGYRGGGE